MDKIQEAADGFIEAGKDPAELLQFADVALDEVTFFIKMAVILSLNFAIGFRGNHRDSTFPTLNRAGDR